MNIFSTKHHPPHKTTTLNLKDSMDITKDQQLLKNLIQG